MGAAETLATHTGWTTYENRHDMSHAEEYLHDDIVINQSGAEGVRGIAAYRAMMEAQHGAFPDWRVVLDAQFATDDRACLSVARRWDEQR
jgi:hypothetical protein